MSLRISATLLESFRRWDELEDSDLATTIEAELIGKIKGEFTWTPRMRLGTAYHSIIERPQISLSGYYEQDGLRFSPEAVTPMLAKLKPGLFEVKTTKAILIAQPYFDEVVLVTKCDHIAGAHISELKTTLDSFDSEKYMASVQWKLMTWLFDAEAVTYHVALLREDDDAIALRSIESLNVFPYPALETEVRELVRAFCSYLHQKGLDGYLRTRPGEKTVVLEGAQVR